VNTPDTISMPLFEFHAVGVDRLEQ